MCLASIRLCLQMVAIVESIGQIWGISTSILGVTVIAVGNSVGDYVADTAAARGADARMAVAACFGSPLLSSMLVRATAPSTRQSTSCAADGRALPTNAVAAAAPIADAHDRPRDCRDEAARSHLPLPTAGRLGLRSLAKPLHCLERRADPNSDHRAVPRRIRVPRARTRLSRRRLPTPPLRRRVHSAPLLLDLPLFPLRALPPSLRPCRGGRAALVLHVHVEVWGWEALRAVRLCAVV